MNNTAAQTISTPKTIAIARFMDLSFNCEGITYGINRNGKHVVIIHMLAGRDICPTIFRFDTVEEARECWKKNVSEWKSKGMMDENVALAMIKARLEVAA